ncbi:hypothetical protein [Flavobacterium sp.]|uniref:hypothetical protein n=1 Tax=Flavobacterium sp. TaxID=239 RepID=UPI0028BEDD23|nr:hypothetical protein [Flavobacterium sp.]
MNKVLLKSAICAFLLFLVGNVSAQNFYSYEQIIQGSSVRSANNFDLVRVKKLITELHPKLYLVNNNVLNTSVTNSYFADIDVASLGMLQNQQNNAGFEIIKINVKNSDNFNIDLSQLRQTYTGLKYVYVSCNFVCDINYIINFFSNNDPEILIIYSASNPI